MKIGISTLIAKPGQGLKVLPLVSEYFKNLELTFSQYFPFEDETFLKNLSNLFKEKKFKILSIHMPTKRPVIWGDKNFIPLDIASSDNWVRNWSIREIEKAVLVYLKLSKKDKFDDEYLVIHCGKKENEDSVKRCVDSIFEIKEYLSPFRVKILIENTLDSSVGKNLEELVHIKDVTDVGICFDTGHGYLANDLSKYDFFDKFTSIHLNDTKGTLDEHLVPGEGVIDYRRFIEEIKRKGFDGNIIFEIYPLSLIHI